MFQLFHTRCAWTRIRLMRGFHPTQVCNARNVRSENDATTVSVLRSGYCVNCVCCVCCVLYLRSFRTSRALHWIEETLKLTLPGNGINTEAIPRRQTDRRTERQINTHSVWIHWTGAKRITAGQCAHRIALINDGIMLSACYSRMNYTAICGAFVLQTTRRQIVRSIVSTKQP